MPQLHTAQLQLESLKHRVHCIVQLELELSLFSKIFQWQTINTNLLFIHCSGALLEYGDADTTVTYHCHTNGIVLPYLRCFSFVCLHLWQYWWWWWWRCGNVRSGLRRIEGHTGHLQTGHCQQSTWQHHDDHGQDHVRDDGDVDEVGVELNQQVQWGRCLQPGWWKREWEAKSGGGAGAESC